MLVGKANGPLIEAIGSVKDNRHTGEQQGAEMNSRL